MLVAIDGPAGAGKSTVARAVAEALGATYLDSGAMYRCIGLSMLEHGGEPADGASAAADAAGAARFEFGDGAIRFNGRDVTADIRSPAVSEAASRVAADPAVRAALVAKQRELVAHGDWVAEGRDIGTVVAPDAQLKVFLTASPEERAQRRALELGGDLATVRREQALRDRRDSDREHSPLRAAQDAIELDTTGQLLEDVVGRIVTLAREAS
jgi:CMP/dCMP kinase